MADPLLAGAQDHWFNFVQDSQVFVRTSEVCVPIMEEATVFRTKTGFDSQMKNTLAAIDRLSVCEEARIYSQNEK